jgi:secreted trypsin-like serine protease
MMAAIVNVRSQSVFCGATIISNKHVLTAAHCLAGFGVNNIGILVGEHDVTTGADTNATKLFRVESYVSHPLYVTNQRDYDIAIITVSGTIAFTNRVGPVCLPFRQYGQSFEGATVIILGK